MATSFALGWVYDLPPPDVKDAPFGNPDYPIPTQWTLIGLQGPRAPR